jgi:hypothetical protein
MSINYSKTFDALAIRDTSAHNGTVIFNGEQIIKTLVVENELNQTVSMQCQGSVHADFSNVFDIGGSWDVSANTNFPQTCDSYYPYWRAVATCVSSPTTGTLTCHILGVPI